VLHKIERILVYAVSPRSLEFFVPIATGKHTHAKGSCTPCRKQSQTSGPFFAGIFALTGFLSAE
jgi:hypothetical protein